MDGCILLFLFFGGWVGLLVGAIGLEEMRGKNKREEEGGTTSWSEREIMARRERWEEGRGIE